jgi:hypothetical protein
LLVQLHTIQNNKLSRLSIKFIISLKARSIESFLSKTIWLITICVGEKIQVQECMILKSRVRSFSIRMDRIRYFSPRCLIASKCLSRTELLVQELIRPFIVSRIMPRIINAPTLMVNLLVKIHSHS